MKLVTINTVNNFMDIIYKPFAIPFLGRHPDVDITNIMDDSLLRDTIAAGDITPTILHVNVGIAEQNACGVAAGLATCGKIPFVSTYAVFGSMRMCEQIRQEICYPNLNVKIACSHAGLTPANDGASHQGVEDMGIMRTLPNMTVVMGCDYWSTRNLVREAYAARGPVYLRFTRDAVPAIYDQSVSLKIGKACELRAGNDATIIANGDVVILALQAADYLKRLNIAVRVLDMHTIKPLDTDAVEKAARETGRIITVEDHSIINGLGSAVCEIVALLGNARVKRIGIQDCFGESAPYERLLYKNGITVNEIAKSCLELLEGGK